MTDVYCPSHSVTSNRPWTRDGAQGFFAYAENKRKELDYANISPQHLVLPLVFSQLGSFSPSLVLLLTTLHARLVGGRKGKELMELPFRVRNFRDIACQRLSITFWRSLSGYMAEFLARDYSTRRGNFWSHFRS